MHKLKISKLVALILLGQVLCLVVVSTAVWELSDLHEKVGKGVDRHIEQMEQAPPDFMRPRAPEKECQFRKHRFLGNSGLISECLSDLLRSRIRQEIAGGGSQWQADCGPDGRGKP